jgi:hypothetical protein
MPGSERSWLIREHVHRTINEIPQRALYHFPTSGSLNRPFPLRLVVEPIVKRSGTGNLRTAVQSYWMTWFSEAWGTRREYPRSAQRRSRPFGSMGCVSSCPEPQFLAS